MNLEFLLVVVAMVMVTVVYMITKTIRGPYCPHHCPRPRPKTTGLIFNVFKKVAFYEKEYDGNRVGQKIAKEFDNLKMAIIPLTKWLQGEKWPFRDEGPGSPEIVSVFFIFEDDVGNHTSFYFSNSFGKMGVYASHKFPLVNIPRHPSENDRRDDVTLNVK
ncbi:MAG: hypothetical protein A3C58_03455 [Candidatus Staskawiczbacteria bacterium RIFCSPHIGHO2_02_FULL_34_10]|uniref:Uncharacterized protein n=2 Tax=Candidatus Staskawicziibacteriota TaxID=1817916 RepID=A0A1G2HKJ6_9BACT|nr:MAG: hypothetical protein A2639_01160 [Candidatus Staskawiczbacteria bacterium RIFCSPHIGHO2_01_FULL_34_27]OGZ66365.1 MAG: hypothetical protein A3C58_03455 [Candidatus Staskawiczbacteria bacterium RIFCSPHIGHO2_02_FULL_34_10]